MTSYAYAQWQILGRQNTKTPEPTYIGGDITHMPKFKTVAPVGCPGIWVKITITHMVSFFLFLLPKILLASEDYLFFSHASRMLRGATQPVSYTHLTLPTILRV